jgi:GAF domain-containing protein
MATRPDRHATSEVSAAFDQLGRLTLGAHDMTVLLQSVADLARTVLPGDTETSVTLVDEGRPMTAVHTGDIARQCDDAQYGADAGPCLEAARTARVIEIPDLQRDIRWPYFSAEAFDRGVRSVLSVPLPTGQHVIGSLNVYARKPDAFDGPSREVAARFAPYAAVALATMGAYRSARDMADNLEQALQSRATIDQAKGILMERHRITAEQSFQLLAQASMATNRKLRDVATHLVETGELPRPPR